MILTSNSYDLVSDLNYLDLNCQPLSKELKCCDNGNASIFSKTNLILTCNISLKMNVFWDISD